MSSGDINFGDYLIKNERWLNGEGEKKGEHSTDGKLDEKEISVFFSNAHIDSNGDKNISEKEFDDWYSNNESAISGYLGDVDSSYSDVNAKEAMYQSMLSFLNDSDFTYTDTDEETGKKQTVAHDHTGTGVKMDDFKNDEAKDYQQILETLNKNNKTEEVIDASSNMINSLIEKGQIKDAIAILDKSWDTLDDKDKSGLDSSIYKLKNSNLSDDDKHKLYEICDKRLKSNIEDEIKNKHYETSIARLDQLFENQETAMTPAKQLEFLENTFNQLKEAGYDINNLKNNYIKNKYENLKHNALGLLNNSNLSIEQTKHYSDFINNLDGFLVQPKTEVITETEAEAKTETEPDPEPKPEPDPEPEPEPEPEAIGRTGTPATEFDGEISDEVRSDLADRIKYLKTFNNNIEGLHTGYETSIQMIMANDDASLEDKMYYASKITETVKEINSDMELSIIMNNFYLEMFDKMNAGNANINDMLKFNEMYKEMSGQTTISTTWESDYDNLLDNILKADKTDKAAYEKLLKDYNIDNLINSLPDINDKINYASQFGKTDLRNQMILNNISEIIKESPGRELYSANKIEDLISNQNISTADWIKLIKENPNIITSIDNMNTTLKYSGYDSNMMNALVNKITANGVTDDAVAILNKINNNDLATNKLFEYGGNNAATIKTIYNKAIELGADNEKAVSYLCDHHIKDDDYRDLATITRASVKNDKALEFLVKYIIENGITGYGEIENNNKIKNRIKDFLSQNQSYNSSQLSDEMFRKIYGYDK